MYTHTCFCVIIRKCPSTVRDDGAVEGGDEARGERHAALHHPEGPITGPQPEDEDQVDQTDVRLPERGKLHFTHS